MFLSFPLRLDAGGPDVVASDARTPSMTAGRARVDPADTEEPEARVTAPVMLLVDFARPRRMTPLPLTVTVGRPYVIERRLREIEAAAWGAENGEA